MYDNIFHKLSHKFKIFSLCYLNNRTQLAVDECHVNGKLFTWENNAADLNLESSTLFSPKLMQALIFEPRGAVLNHFTILKSLLCHGDRLWTRKETRTKLKH